MAPNSPADDQAVNPADDQAGNPADDQAGNPADDQAGLAEAKRVVVEFQQAIDGSTDADLVETLAKHVTGDYRWRGVDPFGMHDGPEAAVGAFLAPFRASFAPVQRRTDVLFAGRNDADGGESVWVATMGHLLGQFDRPWLDIPPTGRMAFLRVAEFNRVEAGLVAETALFCDVIGMMAQAGHYPLPPPTGAHFVYPGPMTNDGILHQPQPAEEGEATMALVNRMIADLGALNEVANETGDDTCPPEVLAASWHDDMIWYGPTGIGASYTIERYQQQHQYPFRVNLTGKNFNGHVARFAEGDYAGFFGWPNLTNTPSGGFLGLPAGPTADMRVVDIYRRQGDKLAENWVFIDLIHWLGMQGLDVLGRMRQLLGLESAAPRPRAATNHDRGVTR